MTSPTQSPRDRILWILTNSGGKMERSRLIKCTGMKLADLNLILEELAREGRVRILDDMVSLMQSSVKKRSRKMDAAVLELRANWTFL